jgi:ATP-dependent DNA helicase RecG
LAGLPLNLDDLLHTRAVETNRVEFKGTWDERIKLDTLHTICGFANDLLNLNGGYVVLGVNTDSEGRAVLPPRGLGDLNLEEIQKEIRGQCNRLDPVYQPVLFPETYQERWLLIIWAPGGDNRPYQAPETLKGGERAYYVRQGPETVKAKGDLLRQLLERAAKVPFDDRRNGEAPIEGISPTLVRRFLADVRSDLVSGQVKVDDMDLYRKLRLVAAVNDHEIPRNVALLFFNENPEKFFPGARIEVVQFADDAGGNLIEERPIVGPVPEQIRLCLDNLNSLADVLLEKVPNRAEVDRTVAYPYEAMEEAVVNAVYHRSYDNTSEPTKVYLYPDRMEIISYPGPVQGIDLEHLQHGRSVPPVPARNRRIGEFLKELRLAEGRGTGLPKIRRKMEENGSPEPRFDFDEGRTYFRAVLPAHPRYVVLHALRESARLWAIGERANALANLQRAFDQQPGSGALASQIIEYAGDDLELGRSTLDRFHAQSRKSEAALPYLRLARILLDRKETAGARRILEMIPPAGASEDIVEAAILRKKMGDDQEAHRLFARAYPALMDDPKVVHEFAQTKLGLAARSFRKRDFSTSRRLNEEAVELLHRALQLATDPTREAWLNFDLARALERLREPATQVEAAFLKALAIRPDEPKFNEAYRRWKERPQRGERRSRR